MTINSAAVGVADVYIIEGEIDLYNSPELKDVVIKGIEKGRVNVIINMAKVKYIDSSGIGALISIFSSAKQGGGSLKIAVMTEPVRKVFRMAMLDSFFQIFDSEAAAIDSFANS